MEELTLDVTEWRVDDSLITSGATLVGGGTELDVAELSVEFDETQLPTEDFLGSPVRKVESTTSTVEDGSSCFRQADVDRSSADVFSSSLSKTKGLTTLSSSRTVRGKGSWAWSASELMFESPLVMACRISKSLLPSSLL